MRKAKSKTVKKYNSPHISEGMKKWWKKRKAAQAASAGIYRLTKKEAIKVNRAPSKAEQIRRVTSVLQDIVGQLSAWQKTP